MAIRMATKGLKRGEVHAENNGRAFSYVEWRMQALKETVARWTTGVFCQYYRERGCASSCMLGINEGC